MRAHRRAAFDYGMSSTSTGGVSVLNMALEPKGDEDFFPNINLQRGQSASSVVRNIGTCLPRPKPNPSDARERKRQIWSTHSVGGAVRAARGTGGARLGETNVEERDTLMGGRTLPIMRVLMEPDQPINIRNKAAASIGYMSVERANQPRVGATPGLIDNFLTLLREVASTRPNNYIAVPIFKENEVIVKLDVSGRANLLEVATRGPNSVARDIALADIRQFYRAGARLPAPFTHLLCPRCGLGVPRSHPYVRDYLHHDFDDHIPGGDPDTFNYGK